MKLFVSTSFSGKVDHETGLVLPEFRKPIEEILESLRTRDKLKVFCAVEREGWKISNEPPEIGVAKDLEEIAKADAVLALLHDQPSAGVQFEMGEASGAGKKVFAATKGEDKLAYFNQGLANLGRIIHLTYDDPGMLTRQIVKLLSDVE